jgi:hypothetical protein
VCEPMMTEVGARATAAYSGRGGKVAGGAEIEDMPTGFRSAA